MNTAAIEHLPRVEAGLRYLEPTSEKPRSLEFDPPPGVPRTTAVYREHTVAIRNVRPVASTLSLEHEGFQLLTAPTSVRDFNDEEAIRTRYYAEAMELLEELTGASRVVVFDHTIRRRIPGAADRATGIPRQPVPRVHNDYTVKSGPQRVRELLGDGRSAARFRIRPWPSAMRAASLTRIWLPPISSIRTAPVRSTT
jgi:hypothetical protein